MTHAVKNIKNGVKDGLISVEDIDEKLIYGSTFTGSFENVDLLIRTSGEYRLSDYLSWHVSDRPSSVMKSLWQMAIIYFFSFTDAACSYEIL